jgi:LacI family transcriptional regulator
MPDGVRPASFPAPRHGPTLRDIARHLGLSRTTISLALNNHPRIPAETRRRVCAAAQALGYSPDPKVSRLMSYLRVRRQSPGREVIAVINAFPTREPWATNTHLRTMRDSLHARAATIGYGCEDFWLTEPRMTPARLSGILRARGIAGVVLLPFPHYTPVLELAWEHFACAAIGASVGVPLHRVCPHQYRDTRRALRSLAALGYRRPGLVLNPDVDQRVEHAFLAAYLVAQRERAVPPDTLPLMFAGGPRQFLRWFARSRPDALLLAQPPPSQDEVRAWLAEMGRHCPADIGLALLDVPHHASHASGIRQSYGPIAAAALDVVAGQLARGERGLPALPQMTQLEGEWQNGTTTRIVSARRPRAKARAARNA